MISSFVIKYLSWSTCIPYFKCQASPTLQIWKGSQSLKLNLKDGHVTLTTPHIVDVIRRIALAMVNLYTEFEVSSFTLSKVWVGTTF